PWAPPPPPPLSADGGALGRGRSGRSRMAVRAQVGRLPLPRLPRRERGRAPVEGRRAARPVLPRDGRDGPGGRRAPLRARRGAGDPERGIALLRRPPPADPS